MITVVDDGAPWEKDPQETGVIFKRAWSSYCKKDEQFTRTLFS